MKFIVEYYTSTGSKQMELEAGTYREAEGKASGEMEKRSDLLGIKCIREIRLLKNKRIREVM